MWFYRISTIFQSLISMGGLFLDVCLAHISNRMPNLKCDCRKVASPCDKNACTPALRQRIVKIRKTIEFVYIVSFPTNVRGLLWNTELGFQCSESERGAKKCLFAVWLVFICVNVDIGIAESVFAALWNLLMVGWRLKRFNRNGHKSRVQPKIKNQVKKSQETLHSIHIS